MSLGDFAYCDTRRVVYGEDRATFVPVCPRCGRYVKADATVTLHENAEPSAPNATCRRCGRVGMPFEGYY